MTDQNNISQDPNWVDLRDRLIDGIERILSPLTEMSRGELRDLARQVAASSAQAIALGRSDLLEEQKAQIQALIESGRLRVAEMRRDLAIAATGALLDGVLSGIATTPSVAGAKIRARQRQALEGPPRPVRRDLATGSPDPSEADPEEFTELELDQMADESRREADLDEDREEEA